MPTIDSTFLLHSFRQHRHQDVVEAAKSISPGSIDEPRIGFVIAASYFSLGQYQDALSFLEPIEADYSADASYLSLYGATCRRLGKLDLAKRLLKKALAADPTAKEPQNNYANLLIDLGEYREARLMLQALVEKYPDYVDARTNLNRLAYREGVAHEDANQEQLRAESPPDGILHIDSDSPWDPLADAFSEQEIHDTQQRYRKNQRLSQVLFRKLVDSIPVPTSNQIASDQLRLATALMSEGNLQEALKLCTSILALQTLPSSLCYSIASQAYLRLGRTREAENCLLQSVVLGDSSFSSFINLASFALMRRDSSLALHYPDRAAGIDPSAPILSSLREEINTTINTGNQHSFRFQDAWHNSDAKLHPQKLAT